MQNYNDVSQESYKGKIIGDNLTDKITAINAGMKYKVIKFEKKII